MINYYLDVLKNFKDFNGRARRSEFWYFQLVNLIIAIILGVIASLIGSPILSGIYALIILVPGIAVAVRRMHDVGKNWYYALIPIYNIILCVTEGDRGANEYEEDPKNNIRRTPDKDFH